MPSRLHRSRPSRGAPSKYYFDGDPTKRLDESLKAFAERPLQEPFAYLILDARYECDFSWNEDPV
jgi:hypothetical protein